ncbi:MULTISPECIES: helix-turn-helix domain-containing protein [unclassified Novosphingobium]|uniref:helix-turn-helix domain-containing protein n=1 Tax=unclassified Novosphingobium TaxID=2644732 RepID=UPI00146B6492|nr:MULTISPECIES: helix-turn-helix domain-containing protein [unclassified Novosphingobium]NMN02961.1 excisionase family DNA binding protein [Novosphingobium sp. SG919]NMN87052.1 excisionase family DNA binding protein [Novosphingobium sp. SG916]
MSIPFGQAKPASYRVDPLTVRIPEACRLTGIGRSKLYELITDGSIEIVKVGGMTLIPFESLKRLIAVGREGHGL